MKFGQMKFNQNLILYLHTHTHTLTLSLLTHLTLLNIYIKYIFLIKKIIDRPHI